ncbi:23S rRNA (adenine(2030)-N(6))-methyltransferase RlmJ [Celeribacter halophilus]|uniref:Ribosomal RNA large subunit methyltransferase J n=1 Tax=Celeribacter halophilus TaxID=576117 RepID=A0AAW7XSU2_9RHOB|nr:23S rRNA (adenine(2030)-N(6))-methyltransferase RlmJ [Celeribacter halophilus]MDO6457341.1 23S rRNA (adenine(2030)-N(6))-methyltransferase RlmJ [Celeribacter halophilus]MDO6722207.1 23S rRNA (adenine(2030)-N(6))-methyltransferase RlmJ [Celeribacter halophilus]
MLSYQHGFHAGNLADVQKHALLATMLDYLTRKDKPLSYIETHAGRALYDLAGSQAQKTGEAAQGIEKVADWFKPSHPYARARKTIAETHTRNIYPGSPAIAQALLRDTDQLHLAELHPTEFAELKANTAASPSFAGLHIKQQDGIQFAQSICPPEPKRGLMLIDPSYEIKSDFETLPSTIYKLHRKWNVGIIALWYPILKNGTHLPLVEGMKYANFPGCLHTEVRFKPAQKGHGMHGSGMFVINAPYGLAEEAARLTGLFNRL